MILTLRPPLSIPYRGDKLVIGPSDFSQLKRQYFGWGKVYAHKIILESPSNRYTCCWERVLFLTKEIQDKSIKDGLIDSFMLGATQTFLKDL